VLFLVRLPTIALLVMLGALVHRWATEMYGRWGGLLALVVCTFGPNLLAHGRLLTLDLPAAACTCLVLYAAWRFWARSTWWHLIALGVALGLAGATRYTLGFLVPVLVATPAIFAGHSRKPGVARSLMAFAAAGVVAAFTVWAIYGFTFGKVPGTEMRLPAPAYFYDLRELLTYRRKPQDAFLLGKHYTGGWWPYFLVTMAVKMPLPTLALLCAAFVSIFTWRDIRRGEWMLLIASGFYYGLSLLSPFNIGHRHLLPILPLLSILVGRLAPRIVRGRAAWRYATAALVGWLAWGTLRIHPHYLAYFNELVGPRSGYRVLVDSNLDWGQDLPALEKYVEEHEVSYLYLSWFGESRPSQYNIPHRFIPSKPDELTDIFTRAYHPEYPPPGDYAISATNLQGLLFDDKELFGYFLGQEPVAQPGYSVMIYKVPRLLDPDAAPVTVALGSAQIDQVPSGVFEDFWHTNDLRLRWFDPETSCILPAESDIWYILSGQAVDGAFLCPHWEQAQAIARTVDRKDAGELSLYRVQPDQAGLSAWLDKVTKESSMIISDEVAYAPSEAPELRQEVSPPLSFDDRLELVGYDTSTELLQPGEAWYLVTHWQVTADGGRPLKAFVQLLDDDGNPRAQYDGFDVPSIGWRTGDILVQRHSLSIPGDLEPSRYWVQVGLYDAATKERLPVLRSGASVGTRVLLPPLEVK
jgi:4-amino-4-deoxy-L-arabinose transferase-like glycosyltransferase